MTDQLIDHPPENILSAEKQSSAAYEEMSEAAKREDIGAQPDPEAPGFLMQIEPRGARSIGLSDVVWPTDDKDAPDFAFLGHLPGDGTFDLTADVLETLFTTGRYSPHKQDGVVAFALRGAELTSGNQDEQVSSVSIRTKRPDHRKFCCVLGFYFPETKLLNVYTGSTVPCRKAIAGYANGGSACNMLPTGMHTFYIWRHRNIKPALRMGRSSIDPETGADATVLRSRNDGRIETLDIFDLSKPYDNVHCSYYLSENASLGASFSSWGCLTVRGRKDPSHQWARFQRVLDSLGAKKRVDLLLATGKEAALAAAGGHEDALTALRFGSRGDEVVRLQRHLGLTETGYLGAVTLDRMTGAERAHNQSLGNGKRATGVYTPAIEASSAWGVFT